jgi:hypothetical protein
MYFSFYNPVSIVEVDSWRWIYELDIIELFSVLSLIQHTRHGDYTTFPSTTKKKHCACSNAQLCTPATHNGNLAIWFFLTFYCRRASKNLYQNFKRFIKVIYKEKKTTLKLEEVVNPWRKIARCTFLHPKRWYLEENQISKLGRKTVSLWNIGIPIFSYIPTNQDCYFNKTRTYE